MSEELQNLLDKFHEVGVKKTEAECSELLAKARKDAQAIIDQAQAEATATLKNAEEQATALQARTESAVRQAARDIILELQGELNRRIATAVANVADQALTPEFMTSLIRDLATKFADNPNAEISVLTTVKDAEALEKTLRGALLNSFHTEPKVLGNAEIKGGCEVSFKDGQVYFDFTGEAVTGLVADFIGSRLAKLLEIGK